MTAYTDQVQERIDRLERMEPVFNDLLAALEAAPEPMDCPNGRGKAMLTHAEGGCFECCYAEWYGSLCSAAIAKAREVKP